MAAHLHFREFIRAYQQTSTLLTTTIVLEYPYVLTARTLVRVPTFMHRIPVSEDLEKRIHILYLIFPHNYSIHTFSNNCCCCSLSSFDSNPILCIDGDGWQGAEISISTCDGTEVLAATTLSCAYEDYFCVDDFGEQDVVVTVTDDSWSSEVEWELFDSNGLSLIQGNDCEYASTADDAESTCPVYDSTTFSCDYDDYYYYGGYGYYYFGIDDDLAPDSCLEECTDYCSDLDCAQTCSPCIQGEYEEARDCDTPSQRLEILSWQKHCCSEHLISLHLYYRIPCRFVRWRLLCRYL